MSIVMPRCFSSSSRSASMPVSALTSAVLPWSIWPAVPTIMFFMTPALILLLAGAATCQESAVLPTFRSGISLVKIDAQVVDRSGRIVAGLKARDFEILDDGQPQK